MQSVKPHGSTHQLYARLAITAIVLMAYWLRLEGMNAFPPGLTNDEAVNAVDAFHLSQTGNFPLYEDPNRPEPLYRILLGLNVSLFGSSVWAFRFMSVIFGTLSVAAAYWCTTECLHDLKPTLRLIAGLTAAGALAVALGHITLSRLLERGVLQPLFMFLFAGFLLRGLRTGRLRDYALAGLHLGILMYTYTAALVLPATLVVLGLSLLIFRRKIWRHWLPRLLVTAVIFAILVAPVGLLFLRIPGAVIGRAAEVRADRPDLGKNISAMIGQFFTSGDENPAYNVESAPLLPSGFAPLFVVGLLALIWRFRQPSSALAAAFLILSMIPVIASNEITHGLRIVGEFAALALIIGISVGMGLSLATRFIPAHRDKIYAAALVAFGILFLSDSLYARRTYAEFWSKPELWKIHGRELRHGEWFFRTDRRDFALWLAAQDRPILLPVDELSRATTRTWLMPSYPHVTTAGADFQLPANTRLVVPWSLELGDLMRETRLYALLQDGTITLLPPLSKAAHAALLKDIDSAASVVRSVGDINLLARLQVLSPEFKLSFEPEIPMPLTATFGDAELQLVGWRGPDTIPGTEPQTLIYTLDWRALKPMGHEYSAYLQLQTQDYQRIGGDDVRILRWLFPTTVWRNGDVAPDQHTFEIPGDLPSGAYRLVTGVYPFLTPNERLPITVDGKQAGDSLTIGWVKVPQREMPAVDPDAVLLDAAIGNDFALRGAEAVRLDSGRIQLTLYWESLTERPSIDATIFVHVADPDGVNVTQDDARPWGGQYPTFIWSKGELIQTVHLLDIADAPLDDLSVMAGMYTFPTLDRLAVIQNGEPVSDNRVNIGNMGDLLR